MIVLDKYKAQFLAFGSLYSNRETARYLSILPETAEDQKKLYSMYWDIDNRSTMIERVGELSEGKRHTDIFSMEEFDLKNPIIQVIFNKINNAMEFLLLTVEDFYQCKTILARNSVNIGYFRESEAYRYVEKISLSEIKKVYRKLAKAYHPDLNHEEGQVKSLKKFKKHGKSLWKNKKRVD